MSLFSQPLSRPARFSGLDAACISVIYPNLVVRLEEEKSSPAPVSAL